MSLDRFTVRPDSTVQCPLRGTAVHVDDCASCSYVERIETAEPERVVVCDGRYVLGWLGLEADV